MGLFDSIFKKKEKEISDGVHPELETVQTKESKKSTLADATELKLIEKYLEECLGSPGKPIRVEKEKLIDGSTYTGEAITLEDGSHLPYGFGKKTYVQDGNEVIMTGHFVDGNVNGVCYMNMHFAMITGRFINSQPYGWILSLGNGVLFGAFENGDFTEALSKQVMWIQDEYREYKGFPIGVFPKRKTIIFGQPYKAKDGVILQKAIGMQFTDNGDVYVGIDEEGLSKTGYFVKYCSSGYIEIGYYSNGELTIPMSFVDLLTHYPNANNAKNRSIQIDTKKKYF